MNSKDVDDTRISRLPELNSSFPIGCYSTKDEEYQRIQLKKITEALTDMKWSFKFDREDLEIILKAWFSSVCTNLRRSVIHMFIAFIVNHNWEVLLN